MRDMPARLLRLLSLLQTRREWPGAELSERLGVTGRTVRRDIERLRALGYPVDATTGVAGGYRLASGTNLPPLLLDDEEAVAVAVGLRTSAGSGVAGIEDSSVRALAKLEQVLPARLRAQVAAVGDTTVKVPRRRGPRADPATLTVLATACRDHETVSFAYTGRDGAQATRRVEPHSLVAAYGLWYLIAFDPGRDDWRTFRVDRVADPVPGHRRFAPRALPATDAAAFLAATITSAPYRYTAEATVRAPAALVRDRLRTLIPGRIVPLDDHTCAVSFGADSLDLIVGDLVALDAGFSVTGPAELLDRLRTVGRRLTEGSAADLADRDAGGDALADPR
ncbi:helix-turn-helix transcriptional regulator [Streptosporangium sp. KLBMP 9127]|nr:YafY family transcriptional regulator [Streptosporangium sp. KLBMP 9127]